jgi:UDP-glucose 4-epimerase
MRTCPRILITGGLGFIGGNLVHRLNGRFMLRVLDDGSTGSRSCVEDADIDVIDGDIRDSAIVEAALDDVDLVVHLAAHTRVLDSIMAPRQNFETNVVGTMNVLLGMRERGMTRLVSASTGGAILGDAVPPVHERMVPAPLSPYGASKLAAEGYCSAFAASYGMNLISLRFSNVYGPGSLHKGSVIAVFMKQILRKEEIVVYGDGSQVRDFVYVGDIVAGIESALSADTSGVFQLGSGIPTSINQLLKLLSDVLGESKMPPVCYAPFRTGEVRETWCDIGRARAGLHFEPSMDLDDGLRETWRWFNANWEHSMNK